MLVPRPFDILEVTLREAVEGDEPVSLTSVEEAEALRAVRIAVRVEAGLEARQRYVKSVTKRLEDGEYVGEGSWELLKSYVEEIKLFKELLNG